MCMVDGLGEHASVYSEREYTARKQWRCTECERDILPGERYHYNFQVVDGQPDEYRWCAHCGVGLKWLGVVCRGWLFYATTEDLRQHMGVDGYPWVALGRHVVGRRRKWRRKDGTLLPLPRSLPVEGLPMPSSIW